MIVTDGRGCLSPSSVCDGAEVTRAGFKVQARYAHHGGHRCAGLVDEFGWELEAGGRELGRNLAAEWTGGHVVGERARELGMRPSAGVHAISLGGSGCACFAVKPAAALPGRMPVLL